MWQTMYLACAKFVFAFGRPTAQQHIPWVMHPTPKRPCVTFSVMAADKRCWFSAKVWTFLVVIKFSSFARWSRESGKCPICVHPINYVKINDIVAITHRGYLWKGALKSVRFSSDGARRPTQTPRKECCVWRCPDKHPKKRSMRGLSIELSCLSVKQY